ncbi:pilin [Pseudoalteromonas piscicida]|uniref:pilin n=1 Tax=Pseudoalteromonas piscicida TaxID=43662 RepID=UPI0032BFA463
MPPAKRVKAFTLIEVLISILILGILISIAVPNYNLYTDRAKFSEVVLASALYKNAVEMVYLTGRSKVFSEFDGGHLGIPNNDSDQVLPNQFISKATVIDGVITIESNIIRDGKGVTLVLTPVASENGTLSWRVSGTCVDAGLC